MQIGLSTSCYFTKVNTEDALPRIKQLGADRFEAFLGGMYEYQEAFAKDMAKSMRDLSMQCTTVHTLGSQFEPQLFAGHPRQRNAALDVFKMVLDCVKILGASYYVMHGTLFLKQKNFRPNYQYVGERFCELCELADSYQVRLTLENVHWCQYHEVGFAKALEPYLSQCDLGYTLDIKQAAQSGFPMEGYMQEMGQRLCNVHLCDITEKDGRIYTSLPGQGAFDFADLSKKLKEKNFQGAVTMEVYPDDWEKDEALKRAYEYLKTIFE